MNLRNWLALGIVAGQTMASLAADAAPALSLDEARAQRVGGKTAKAEAEKIYERESEVCRNQAIAINCMDSARLRFSTP